jgi:hypothetical protein
MTSRKKAMIQPPPAKPASRTKPKETQRAWSFKDEDLAKALHRLGNNRPYHILETLQDGWLVHFLGDSKPSIVKFEGDKPVIKTR